MRKKERKQRSTWWLIAALVAVVLGGVVFVGAVSGWFDDGKVEIDVEYRDKTGLSDIAAEEYEKLIEEKKSFVVLVDQNGCNTADKMRDFVNRYSEKYNMSVHRVMFEDMKNTSLHDAVKYYPSVAIVGDGKIRAYLRADSDDDAKVYNNYDDFEAWMNRYIRL